MRRSAGRLGTSALAVFLAVASAAVAPAATRAASPESSTDRVELDRPARGDRAVRLLGDRLDEAAARNGMTAAVLTELLATDPSAWVDTSGAVFFKEATAPAPADDPVSAQASLDQTFALHSKPDSTKTIFLDFDGGTASATGWHASYPATPTTQPAWDPAGDGAAFSDSELTSIQTIWQAVAEDYAPFDVDVTTQDPGPAGINRSSSGDTAYGSHVLVTPSVGAQEAICPSGCGGVAYISVFGKVTSGAGDGYGYNQPAWVFPQKLGNSSKNIAEAASHEAGHNFGLRHDANSVQGYDRGHGPWAPIMGVGYDHPISQWSRGDYPDANNQEDDVAIIRGVVGSRADEAPAGIAAAPRSPTGAAYVTTREDVDTYLLGACSGSVSVTASPLPSLANLDIELTLRDVVGDVVATADPPSAQTSSSVASGLGASVSLSLGAGLYYVSLDGVGNGPWSTGYDDYGSLGAYTLSAAGCDSTVLPTPTATDLVATAAGRTVTLAATPSTTAGALVGEVVFREGGAVVGIRPLGAALTLPSVAPGTHTYSATFRPTGVTHTSSVSADRAVTVRATSTTGLAASASGSDVTLRADIATDGGPAAGTVEFRDGGALVGASAIVGGGASLGLGSVAPGDHAYQATFVPSDPTAYAGSSSPVRTVTVGVQVVASPLPAPSVSASTTTLRAPRKAKAGTRPTVTVTATRGAGPAAGAVVVTVGKWSRTVTLKAGSAKVRLPELKGRKAKVTARYGGDPTTYASSARRTIKVVG